MFKRFLLWLLAEELQATRDQIRMENEKFMQWITNSLTMSFATIRSRLDASEALVLNLTNELELLSGAHEALDDQVDTLEDNLIFSYENSQDMFADAFTGLDLCMDRLDELESV